MNNIHVLLISHKKIQTDIGGIESMATLLMSKMPFHEINLTVICQGASISNFVSVINADHQIFVNSARERKVVFVEKARVPYLFYVTKEILYSLLATLVILDMIKKIRKKGYKLVLHAFDTIYGGFAASIASAISKAPLIAQTHGLRSEYIRTITTNRILTTLDYLIEKSVVTNSKLLISVNEEALMFWKDRGIQDDRLQLIRVPIDLEKFKRNSKLRKDMRNELKIENDTFVIGYVGRLSDEKNIATLVMAFSDAYSAGLLPTNSKLVIVGDGQIRNKLTELSKSLSLEKNVIFTSFRKDIPSLMNGIDVLVLPSFVEGNPTVVLEAMATGVPVICSDIPANREIAYDLQTKALFNAKDISALSHLLSLLSRNKRLASEMSKKGMIYVRAGNDVNKTIEKLKELYVKLK